MKKRPGFPVQLDAKTPDKPATAPMAKRLVTPQSAVRAAATPIASPTGMGLDSSAVRARMVQ